VTLRCRLPLLPALKRSHIDLGRKGEHLAARYLSRRGYRLLGRNLHTAAGEADLLCEDPHTGAIVLVEVKTRRRSTAQRGVYDPEHAVHVHKARRLLRIARCLRKANNWQHRPFRIDVIAVDFVPNARKPIIRHHTNAVSASTPH